MAEPEYPTRPRFFATKFIRAMVKVCVATEHGPEVFTLLTIIVSTEDAAHYRRPVVFLNDQLASVCGVTMKQLYRVRERAVAAGWLHYVPGRRKVAPRYWVVIPDHAAGLDDLPTDEGDDYLDKNSRAEFGKSREAIGKQSGNDRETIGEESGNNREMIGKQSGNTLIPDPNPDPVPDKGAPPKPPAAFEPIAEPAHPDPDRRALADQAAAIAVNSVEPVVSWEEFARVWAEAGPGKGKPPARSRERVGWLQQRCREPEWTTRWREAVGRLGRSRFARGETGKAGVQVDTFLKTGNTLTKALEGDYDDHAPAGAGKGAAQDAYAIGVLFNSVTGGTDANRDGTF